VLESIASEGASFITDLQMATSLSPLMIREALRELVAFELVTNDTAEAMRQIVQWKPLVPEVPYDPERWLPEAFVSRPVRQRRPNLRRLPKWRRPDMPGGGGLMGWGGRWSLIAKAGTLGPVLSEEEHVDAVVRQWFDRYGIVSRDWWRRERPPVSWRSIYHELKRREFRGEVRRGYFVRGLAGAQFALPDAVERLREVASHRSDDAPFSVIAASDPANVYTLPFEGIERYPLSRPRGAGAVLVTRSGEIVLAVEGRGKRVQVSDAFSREEVAEARRVLDAYLNADGRS
jgi:ATP-dependent Lhr-like helicase